MQFKKITAGFLAAAMAVTSVLTVSVSADWNVKEGEILDPGLELTSGTWAAQIYNVGDAREGISPVDYGLDLSKVGGVRAVFTVDEDPETGYDLFEGCVGGQIGISVSIPGEEYGSELYNKYTWPNDHQWWGMEYTDSNGEIINTDPNFDPSPENDNALSTNRIGDHTYELIADYTNPFIEDGVEQVDNMEVFIQQWYDLVNYYTVNYVEILDDEGNVMLTFDEYGRADKENLVYTPSDPDRDEPESDITYSVFFYPDSEIDLEKVTGARFEIEITSDHDAWDGLIGGGIGFSYVGGDIGYDEDSELFTKYSWMCNSFWGFYDEELGIDTVDRNQPVVPVKTGDYTYSLEINGVDNPLNDENISEIESGYVMLQNWGKDHASYIVNSCELLDEYGNVLAKYDHNTDKVSESTTQAYENWITLVYGDPDYASNEVVYPDLDLSAITGLRFTVYNDDPDWAGEIGGAIVFDAGGGELGNDYTWVMRMFWGITDEEKGIDNSIYDPSEGSSFEVQGKKVADNTYAFEYNGFANPFADGYSSVGIIQIAFQQWGYELTPYTVLQADLLDKNGNVLMSFDGVTKEPLTQHEHIADTPVKENIIDATCGADGSYDEVVYCSECGKELSRDTVTVPATGNHTYVDKVVAPTYTSRGYTEHTCYVCGYSYKDAYTAKKTVPAVTGLKLKSRATDALRIAWNKNTSADGYIVEMKDGSKWTRVGKITKNSTVEFKKSKLKAGTAYTFRVKAYEMDGKTAIYSGYTTISARTNPSAISGLKLKARAADAIRLAWNKNTSADGYIIEMKNGSTWTRVGKITKNSTVEFKKSKLKAGTAYTFRVKAYKMSGKTALYGTAKTISVRTNPSTVSGLKLKNSAKNAVRLSWNKNTSADGYIVEMKVGGAWKRAAKISKNSTVEFKKSGLKSKTSYSFRVKAYKMSGKTALYGATKTITVKTK